LREQPLEVQATLPLLRIRDNTLSAPLTAVPHDGLLDQEKAWLKHHSNNKLHGVAVGSRVRFIRDGSHYPTCQENAAAGTVTSFKYDGAGWLTAILVRMDRTQDVTPVRRLAAVGDFLQRRYFCAAFWPVSLAHATTTHSVQGRTVAGRVHFDPQDLFEPGLGYVGVSRVRELAYLTLGKRLTPYDLRVVDLEEFWRRYDAGLPPDPKRRRPEHAPAP